MTLAADNPSPATIDRGATPPGPVGASFLSNTLKFRRDPLGYLEEMATYGDVTRYRMLGVTFYQVNHPDGVQRVLQENHRNYIKGDLFDILRQVAGNGLFTSEGEQWLRQRRLMQPAFHRRRIASFGEIMTARTLDVLARWQQRSDPSQAIDIAEEMTDLTMAIITETMFGARLEGDTQAISQALTLLLDDINFRFRTPFYPSLRWPTLRNRRALAAMRIVDAALLEIVEKRRRSGEQRDDLLGMLMSARDEDSGAAMSDKDLRDEVITIFVAGHETTAVVLTWTFYLLNLHGEIESRLHAELAEVLGGRAPGMADLPNLRFTRNIIDEALRLYPPAWITNRQAVATDVVCGFRIPAGAYVALSPYVAHHLSAYWPQPKQFDPDRFDAHPAQGASPALAPERPRFAYMPFGGGPHLCIGNQFALTEATLILATIASRYRLRLVPGQDIRPAPRLTLRPNGPVLMTPAPL